MHKVVCILTTGPQIVESLKRNIRIFLVLEFKNPKIRKFNMAKDVEETKFSKIHLKIYLFQVINYNNLAFSFSPISCFSSLGGTKFLFCLVCIPLPLIIQCHPISVEDSRPTDLERYRDPFDQEIKVRIRPLNSREIFSPAFAYILLPFSFYISMCDQKVISFIRIKVWESQWGTKFFWAPV